MKPIFVISIAAIFGSCTDNSQAPTAAGDAVHSNANDTIVTGAQPVMIAGCYQMIHGKDTAQMQLITKGASITGNLVFDWAEKDGNKGTLAGKLVDSLIVAQYRFESEGMMSVREEVFKIKDSVLVRGYGEIKEENGVMMYADKANLNYDTIQKFRKVKCSD